MAESNPQSPIPNPKFESVSKKSIKIAQLIADCAGRGFDAHYIGYFECFNRGWFYEAHDVLEELWLQDRHGPQGNFYKGLIQFAGAFVHLQKHSDLRPRLRPAAALFKLAQANLVRYPGWHQAIDVGRLLALIEEWLGRLETARFAVNPLATTEAPILTLPSAGSGSAAPG
jgi:predicted metal-dependent hydrolase